MDNYDERIYASTRTFLRIFLVLSMIGSGLALIGNLLYGLTLPTVKDMYESGMIKFDERMTVMFEQMLEDPQSYYLCMSLLYAGSLAGVILMWNLRKSGFHLYTLAQLLVPVVTVLFIGKERFGFGDLMLTLLFVVFYYFSLKRLGVFTGKTAQTEKNSISEEKDFDDEEAD